MSYTSVKLDAATSESAFRSPTNPPPVVQIPRIHNVAKQSLEKRRTQDSISFHIYHPGARGQCKKLKSPTLVQISNCWEALGFAKSGIKVPALELPNLDSFPLVQLLTPEEFKAFVEIWKLYPPDTKVLISNPYSPNADAQMLICYMLKLFLNLETDQEEDKSFAKNYTFLVSSLLEREAISNHYASYLLILTFYAKESQSIQPHFQALETALKSLFPPPEHPSFLSFSEEEIKWLRERTEFCSEFSKQISLKVTTHHIARTNIEKCYQHWLRFLSGNPSEDLSQHPIRRFLHGTLGLTTDCLSHETILLIVQLLNSTSKGNSKEFAEDIFRLAWRGNLFGSKFQKAIGVFTLCCRLMEVENPNLTTILRFLKRKEIRESELTDMHDHAINLGYPYNSLSDTQLIILMVVFLRLTLEHSNASHRKGDFQEMKFIMSTISIGHPQIVKKATRLFNALLNESPPYEGEKEIQNFFEFLKAKMK